MEHLIKHSFSIDRSKRNEQNQHPSFLIWFTGLSGSGKSTIANLLEVELYNKKIRTYLLDGDNIRLGLNKGLSFSDEDRHENLRRIGEVSKLMIDAGLVTIAAFVSPHQKDREMVRDTVGSENYIEVFVNTPIEECIKRDTKGLYKKAIAGEIKEFTGITSPYEFPISPDIVIDTTVTSKEDAVKVILNKIQQKLKQ